MNWPPIGAIFPTEKLFGSNSQLRHAAAAVLEFLPAPAGARFVAADLWHFAANGRKIEFQFGTVAVGGNTVFYRRAIAVPSGNWPGRSGGAGPLFLEQELRKRGEEILEGLKVRGA